MNSEEKKMQSMPFVAIIGGLWQLDTSEQLEAQAAGRIIGAELAKAGFGLVVYFSNVESLEPHAVSGYVEGLAGKSGAIRVRYADSQRGQVRFHEELARPELFRHDQAPTGKPRSTGHWSRKTVWTRCCYWEARDRR
jgi:hypothetical protein